MALISFVALFIALSQQAPNSVGFDCPPRDEAVGHADLVAFRGSLQQAVARRDAAAILKVTDPHIRTSFGPDSGFAFLERDFRNKNGEIWNELDAVLSGGGSFESPTTFVAPIWFNCGEADEVIVVGARVRVRARPNAGARVLAVLSYAVLKGSEPYEPSRWAEVQLKDGRRGFIEGQFIRSPLGYRAYFSKIKGSWRLMMFIAGD